MDFRKLERIVNLIPYNIGLGLATAGKIHLINRCLYEKIHVEAESYMYHLTEKEVDVRKLLQVQRVITPIDFSDNSKIIAESAAYLSGKFGATMHLVFVVQNFEDYSGFFVPQMSMPNLEGELVEGAEDKMESFCKELEPVCEAAGVVDLQHRVFMGDVAEQIVDYAAEIQGDLIIMGTHGYKGLEKIMFGSVADKVVRSAHCPVMTINPYTCCPESDEE